MSTKLENYIHMHKEELSSFAPSDQLWLALSAGIAKPAIITSKVAWLKYFGFGASAVAAVVATTLIINSPRTEPVAERTSPPPATEAAVSTELNIQLPVPENKKAAIPYAVVSDTPQVTTEPPKAVPALPPLPPVAPVAPVPPVAPTPVVPIAPPLLHGQNIQWKVKGEGQLKADTSFANIKRVELRVSSCDVFIQPSALDKVFFKADITTEKKGIVMGGLPEYEVIYEVKDDVLSIVLQNVCKKQVIVAGSINVMASVNMDIPANVPVSVKNSYGNVMAKGLKADKCQFESSSGDIMLNDMNTDLDIKSGYGYVNATNTRGNIHAVVTSGDFAIEKLEGNAEITSSYGNQVYKEINGNLLIRSTSGDVQIEKMNGNTEIKSNYGNISLNGFDGIPMLEAISGDISGKNVRLKGSMTAKSAYGNIRMTLLNEMKELSFDLRTSYGKINVNKDGAKAEDDAQVNIKQGDILITGITTSGDQSYK